MINTPIRTLLTLSVALAPAVLAADDHESGPAGIYTGFLAFDLGGNEVREGVVIVLAADGSVVFGAEEGQDEAVDPDTGVVTANDFESTTMGAWRAEGDGAVFGVQQFRAGSGLCKAIQPQVEGVLPSCAFVLTARLEPGVSVRGTDCAMGALGGGFSVLSVNGAEVVANPLGLDLAFDYCLEKRSVDNFLELAPLSEN